MQELQASGYAPIRARPHPLLYKQVSSLIKPEGYYLIYRVLEGPDETLFFLSLNKLLQVGTVAPDSVLVTEGFVALVHLRKEGILGGFLLSNLMPRLAEFL